MELITKPKVMLLERSDTDICTFYTMQLEYWRAIHPEFLTHRTFSRNSRSSRATPVKVNIEQVLKTPYAPVSIGKNQKGMVAEELVTEDIEKTAYDVWKSAALQAASFAEALDNLGVHKQVANRLLEPFMPIVTIVTFTDEHLENFFKLRLAKDAQPEIQDLAKAIKEAIERSLPDSYKELHLPYISSLDKKKCEKIAGSYGLPSVAIISAARCARVSYKTFAGTSDLNKDLELGLDLIKNKHLTPFEHIIFVDKEWPNNVTTNRHFKTARSILEECL